MTLDTITILVVDRSLKDKPEATCDLYSAIHSLRERGYSVVTAYRPRDIKGPYHIILLHPAWGDCEQFREIHRAYPCVPMILQSGKKLLSEMPGGIGKTYEKDAEGIYMNDFPTLDGLLELVDSLATTIKNDRTPKKKKVEEPVTAF